MKKTIYCLQTVWLLVILPYHRCFVHRSGANNKVLFVLLKIVHRIPRPKVGVQINITITVRVLQERQHHLLQKGSKSSTRVPVMVSQFLVLNSVPVIRTPVNRTFVIRTVRIAGIRLMRNEYTKFVIRTPRCPDNEESR